VSLTVETLKERFTNLLKINEALTAETDFDALLNLIVAKASELLDADRNELWSKIAQGIEARIIRLPVGQGIAGMVAQTGEIINIADAYQDDRFDPTSDHANGFRTTSMLTVPLRDRQSTLVGVLQVINKRVGDGLFDDDDIDFALALGSSAAIAIQNARLMEALQEQERLKAELEIAGDIQRNLLPNEMPAIEGIELYAFCRPSKEMSGDYYNVMDFGGKVGLVVADVCGKSVPAAFLMALAHNTVRMAMHRSPQPREMLKQAYMLLDLEKMRFSVSNAGQPTYPILVRNGYCFPVELGGLPLGLVEDVEYRQTGRGLRSGDLVLLYTDGVVEAVGPHRDIFSFERLHAIARTCSGVSAREAVERIVAAVDAFTFPGDQSDDITIMAFRVL
jgi:phosphoserine phosphatase RsbU/P